MLFRSRECKWSALRAFFSNGTPILIAGGGRTARWWLKRLQEHEVKVLGLLDIRPSRIGKKILGVPVLEYDALDLGGDVRYLVAVPRWEQRQEIRSHFRAAGRREGVDYVCVT